MTDTCPTSTIVHRPTARSHWHFCLFEDHLMPPTPKPALVLALTHTLIHMRCYLNKTKERAHIWSSNLGFTHNGSFKQFQRLHGKRNHVCLPIFATACIEVFGCRARLVCDSKRNVTPALTSVFVSTSRSRKSMQRTYGVLLGVVPPVGPAVPLWCRSALKLGSEARTALPQRRNMSIPAWTSRSRPDPQQLQV